MLKLCRVYDVSRPYVCRVLVATPGAVAGCGGEGGGQEMPGRPGVAVVSRGVRRHGCRAGDYLCKMSTLYVSCLTVIGGGVRRHGCRAVMP